MKNKLIKLPLLLTLFFLLWGCETSSKPVNDPLPSPIPSSTSPPFINSQVQGQSCEPVPHAVEDWNALNAFWGTRIFLCRIRGANNAYADRRQGVVFADQDWLDTMAATYGNWAATGILAHEWAHMIQGEVSGTAAELQADCLAGVFLRGIGLPWQTVEQFAASNFNAGDVYWNLHGHGTKIQRVNAARRGYYGYAGQQGLSLQQLCPLSAF